MEQHEHFDAVKNDVMVDIVLEDETDSCLK